MQQHEREFLELDTRIVVVTFERGASARAYVEAYGIHFPILIDESRALYRAYGMLRGAWWDIWGPRTWWAYGKEVLRGRTPKTTDLESDVHQLGGDVLIDPAGIVRLLHVGSGPADRPSVGELLGARRA